MSKIFNAESTFLALITKMRIEDVNEILYNWNESELNDANTEILIYVDSRANGPRTGGADIVDKTEFINWLLSDAPFDTEIYGDDIREDEHWVGLVEKARYIINS